MSNECQSTMNGEKILRQLTPMNVGRFIGQRLAIVPQDIASREKREMFIQAVGPAITDLLVAIEKFREEHDD